MGLIGQRYRFVKSLGEGVSAQVILVEDTLSPAPSPAPLVAKVMRRQYSVEGVQESRLLSFLQLQQAPAVSGVVKLIGCHEFHGHVCLILERLHGSLLDLLCVSPLLSAPLAADLNASQD